MTTRFAWARNGAVLGWSDPTFVRGARPTVARSRFSPHVREQRMFLESKMKCMGEPRVYVCNPEATSLGKSSPQEEY